MKNHEFLPFTRNHYFYGKLLTAEDFLLEQRYHNDKRRLCNRYLHGAGIVAGLDVIRVDDHNLSVEMGIALDGVGREIVVELPVIRKLDLLDGYEEATAQEGKESLYLCIEYDEEEGDPVQGIDQRGVYSEDGTGAGRIKEGYHLYVTDDEPAQAPEGSGETPEEKIRSRAEAIRHGAFPRGVYLARVELVKAGEFYIIDRVVTDPYRTLLWNQPMMAGHIRLLEDSLGDMRGRLEELGRKALEGADSKSLKGGPYPEAGEGAWDWQMEEGMASIPLRKGARAGQVFYSQEIPHGLGLGNVQVFLRVLSGECLYGGDAEVFPEEAAAAAAFRLNRQTGTFVIGIRLLEDAREGQVQVGWTALRRRSSNEFREHEPRMHIHPGIVNLKLRETAKLGLVCVNMEDREVRWAVKSAEGGQIEPDGTYHAPNHPGIFEVEAVSAACEGVRASVYVVVRE